MSEQRDITTGDPQPAANNDNNAFEQSLLVVLEHWWAQIEAVRNKIVGFLPTKLRRAMTWISNVSP